MASILNTVSAPESVIEQPTTTQDATPKVVKPLLVNTGSQIAPSPEKKDLVGQLSNVLPRLTYYGPTEFHTKIGDGCSKIAASTTQQLYGIYDPTSSEDAWYAKKSVLDAGGKEVWNPTMKNNYSKMQIGTYVSLDRFGATHDLDLPKNKKYTLKDNEKVEHRGVVVGFDKDGIPLIKHGSSEGEAVVQRMDNLFLKFPTHNLDYTVKSAYTPASIMGKDIVDKRFYTKPEEADNLQYIPAQSGVAKMNAQQIKGQGMTPINMKEPTGSENELKFMTALNNNLSKQMQILGLKKTEANLIAKVAFGVFHNESEAGTSSFPIGLKMLGSTFAKAVGAKKSNPSLSDVQFKFDTLMSNADGSTSKIGKSLLELGVEKEGLSDWTHHRDDYNDEVNAVAASAADALAKIKANPDKFKYDAKNQTVFGNIPLGVALAAAYSKGLSAITSKESLMKADDKGRVPFNYGTNAMKWGERIKVTPKQKSK
jgi:hypothetical protein